MCRHGGRGGLAQRTEGDQIADAILAVAEQRFKDILIVLPERRPPAIDLGRGARELVARVLDDGLAGDRMIDPYEMIAME